MSALSLTVTPMLSMLFMYVAMEKGYYEDEGLNVNIQFPAMIMMRFPLVAAGKSQIGIFFTSRILLQPARIKRFL